eukprot:Sspe_Gene.78027::Locus_48796_Transcript_2_2_Confidence_0.667_Length_1736::g.78027::m.78027/K12580/CNOT3, NOT3; CCR4-NOT transcription complex subunit 3
MAAKKLQTDVDRTIKKVAEGIQTFDDIWNKLHSASQANLKERLQSDLKTEIKKLQRQRDQIKTWQGNSEIRDKRPLEESRRSIEQRMEQFKVCEREAKIKTFSKAGLSSKPRGDSEEVARENCRHFLTTSIDSLQQQLEQAEAEVEGCSKRGKKKGGKVEGEGKERIVQYQFHISKMEQMVRMLDNEQISPDAVEAVQEQLQNFVQHNQEGDYDAKEVQGVYDSVIGDIEEFPDTPTMPKKEAEKKKTEEKQPAKKKDPSEPTTPSTTTSNPSMTPPAVNLSKAGQVQSPVKPAVPSKPSTPSTPSAPSVATATTAAAATAAATATTATTNYALAAKQAAPSSSPTTPPTSAKPSPSGAAAPPSASNPSSSAPSAPAASNPAASSQPSQAKPPAKRSAQARGTPDLAAMEKMLQQSMANIPVPEDTRKRQNYVPSNPYTTPAYYPQQPYPVSESPEAFSRFNADTLFFIFYYQQSTYQQYLAARELKKQSWRFHKKYLTWFQRAESPTIVKDDHEQGTYLFFDFEEGWAQRQRKDFIFKYCYLEDDLTPMS